jgi:Ser/Thr protein kinase RdoA (MazF antagonist)
MLIHSDVHLRNWYIRADGAIGLNDWQSACRGHWGRDVAYALTAAMDVDTRRRMVKPLLQYYLDRLREEGGPATSFEEAWIHYRQQLFSALAFWTITMPSPDLPDMQPVDTTLEMIRRLSCAIDEYDALESFN